MRLRLGSASLWKRLLPVVFLLAPAASAATFHVVNLFGSITLRTGNVSEVQVRFTTAGRPQVTSDVRVVTSPNGALVQSQPADGARLDLEVTVPFRAAAIAQTKDGPLSVEGFFPSADLYTDTGDVRIAAPWQATSFGIQAGAPPSQFNVPKGVKVSRNVTGTGSGMRWTANNVNTEAEMIFGSIRATITKPGRIDLVSIPIPEEAPMKMAWQAPAILEEILAPKRKAPARNAPPAAGAVEPAGDLVFRSEVRLVNLNVSISDALGNPVAGLTPGDFEILEDGVPQQVKAAMAEEMPFNLALLLDLSGSTRNERTPMKEAAERFIGITRPQDRVALYVLGADMFFALSPLTSDHKKVTEEVRKIPRVQGASPVYDTIVLSYAQELRQRAGERNALILISDGIDNQLDGGGLASKVSFNRLRQGADLMDMLIYPVFLSPFQGKDEPRQVQRARTRMEQLASASGGKVFPARSLQDLEPVYDQVARELRSVYSVTYSPKNQEFQGEWRKIQLTVKRPGARVRTRAGYYAR